MADHSELVSELPLVEKMSTQERLKHARKRRLHQLKKWSQREKEYQQMKRKKMVVGDPAQSRPRKKNYKVHFVPSVMLLEAAARNDVEEACLTQSCISSQLIQDRVVMADLKRPLEVQTVHVKVRRLLMLGVSPDSTNEDGLTALHQCCIDDSEEMMKLLLEFGANVNAKDSEQWTPLHAAATCGHLHLVRYLISKDADLLAVNADGNMPYDICEDESTLDYIESEMAKKGITQEMIDETRAIPEKQMLSDLKYLSEEGEDIDYRDHQGATPLHIAAANGYLSVVEFLLDNNLPTDVCDNDMWQPIHAAACWGHPDVIEMLVMAGADLSAKTKNGETPFDICEDHELRERILQLKSEIEIKRASQPQKLRRSHSQNTRSQSVRRTSIRDKSLMSRREAREEARIWHEKQDQNTTDEDEEAKVLHDSKVSEKELLNGEHSGMDMLLSTSSNSGTEKAGRENQNLVEVYQHHPEKGDVQTMNEKNCIPSTNVQETPDTMMESVSLKEGEEVSVHPSGELCDTPLATTPMSPRSQEAVKVEIHVTVNTSPTYAPNHGTLADLKKHRSDMRSRSSLTLNSSQQDISGKMITHNGHTFSATYLYDQPPSPTISLRRFCSDPSEIVGEPHKQGCCAIM